MLRFKQVDLKQVVYYEEATLDLDRRGITVIMGQNLNANVKDRANGAGKTLLVSPIAHLKFGDPSVHRMPDG